MWKDGRPRRRRHRGRRRRRVTEETASKRPSVVIVGTNTLNRVQAPCWAGQQDCLKQASPHESQTTALWTFDLPFLANYVQCRILETEYSAERNDMACELSLHAGPEGAGTVDR